MVICLFVYKLCTFIRKGKWKGKEELLTTTSTRLLFNFRGFANFSASLVISFYFFLKLFILLPFKNMLLRNYYSFTNYFQSQNNIKADEALCMHKKFGKISCSYIHLFQSQAKKIENKKHKVTLNLVTSVLAKGKVIIIKLPVEKRK